MKLLVSVFLACVLSVSRGAGAPAAYVAVGVKPREGYVGGICSPSWCMFLVTLGEAGCCCQGEGGGQACSAAGWQGASSTAIDVLCVHTACCLLCSVCELGGAI